MRATIVDTSAILALFDSGYEEHGSLARAVNEDDRPLIVSPFVVNEADYMLQRKYGNDIAMRLHSDVVHGAFELAQWSSIEHASALEIMRSFLDDDYIGIADASNVVLADRYRTTDIMTLDQRRFRKLQPIWGADYFTLIPYDA
ncbi:PIN domain-containing protein [Glycomyces salinus]|uniref:PIN domain-containing protein n=1 Tax=Glycomyces salinus TaxID=980294 RepID=UPI0018EC71A4|nr:PIN domain-containing protein [Glycomyces salinus]